MSTEPETDDRPPGTVECEVCETDVPAGEFCGLCGWHLTETPRRGPSWLRMRSFAGSAGEHLLTPNITSSLFPQLPSGSRLPFLGGTVPHRRRVDRGHVLPVARSVDHRRGAGPTSAVPLLPAGGGSHRDIPAGTLVLTAALGIGLGVGWVLLTGAAVAKSYGVPLGVGIAAGRDSSGRTGDSDRWHVRHALARAVSYG